MRNTDSWHGFHREHEDKGQDCSLFLLRDLHIYLHHLLSLQGWLLCAPPPGFFFFSNFLPLPYPRTFSFPLHSAFCIQTFLKILSGNRPTNRTRQSLFCPIKAQDSTLTLHSSSAFSTSLLSYPHLPPCHVLRCLLTLGLKVLSLKNF